MKFRLFLLFLFLFSVRSSIAQVDTMINGLKGYLLQSEKIDGLLVPHVNLRQVTIYPPRVFHSKREEKRYNRLVYNVKKVYPYSIIVKNKIYEINKELAYIDSRGEKKDYINVMEDKLKDEFEGQLREMTYTQGRILIKLINRETGETTYEIVKKLKGSLSAFFWQSVALIFSSSLKYEYDAEGDDVLIEEIVVRIENGQL